MTAPLLPPPAETILMYAAWGWAFEQGHIARSGRPKLPERQVWVPMFNDLVQTPAGMSRLKDLALAGCVAWSLSESGRGCLDDAFHDPGITDLLKASLIDLAETARQPFTLQAADIKAVLSLVKEAPPPTPAAEASPSLPARAMSRRKFNYEPR